MKSTQIFLASGGQEPQNIPGLGLDPAMAENIGLPENTAELCVKEFWLSTWRNLTLHPQVIEFFVAGSPTAYKAKLACVDAAVENLLLYNLTTPIGEYGSAILRTNDIDKLHVQLSPNMFDCIKKDVKFLHVRTSHCSAHRDCHSNESEKSQQKGVVAPRLSRRKCPFGPSLEKYWKRRLTLFHRFDEGIKTDAEGLYSVTPEAVARYIATKMSCSFAVVAMAGIGGDTIALARTCDHVVSIDVDARRLEFAQENSRIYGVDKDVDFICADYMHFCRTTRMWADAVLIAPPWGGPKYQRNGLAQVHVIKAITEPCDPGMLLMLSRRMTSRVFMLLPKNLYKNSLQEIADNAGCNSLELEEIYLDGVLNMLLAVFCWADQNLDAD